MCMYTFLYVHVPVCTSVWRPEAGFFLNSLVNFLNNLFLSYIPTPKQEEGKEWEVGWALVFETGSLTEVGAHWFARLTRQ